MKQITKFMNDESGATAIEYALIAALMSAALVAALGSFSTSLKTAFTNIGSTLTTKTK